MNHGLMNFSRAKSRKEKGFPAGPKVFDQSLPGYRIYNGMLTNTLAKEVQATLSLTFYRHISEIIDSQYSQVLSGSLVLCPSSGVYSPIDRFLNWF